MPKRDLRACRHATSRKRHRSGSPLDSGEKGLLAGSSGGKEAGEQAVARTDRAAPIGDGALGAVQGSVSEDGAVAAEADQHCAGATRSQRLGSRRGIAE